MGNLTIRHYFAANKNNLTDFPQALIDVGAIYYIHIDIEKRSTTIANVTITAVDSVNHPVTITGEYYSGTLYWGLTTDALNDNKANLQKGQLSTASTTLTFSLTDSCLVYVSRTVSGLAAAYVVDAWGTKQLCGDANVVNITVSGSAITVTRGSALSGNAFVTVIG
jgi:hypothetical protein